MNPFQRIFTGLVMVAASVAIPAFCNNAMGGVVHPYHVSLCEIEWNPKSGNFEISLCVWPADLEKAIKRQSEGFTLDQPKVGTAESKRESEARDKAIEAYINRRLRVTNTGDRSLNKQAEKIEVRWVGCDIGLKEAWIYLELKPETKRKQLNGKNWQIENRLFFELNDDQINQVNFKNGQTLKHVTLTADHPNGQFGE